MTPFRTIALGVIIAFVAACSNGKSIIGGPISHSDLQNGTFEGTARNGPVKVKAMVTIINQEIADIELIEHRTWKGGAAESAIPDRIIEAQSTKVDAVSGATMSSVAIMNAVGDAVQKAR